MHVLPIVHETPGLLFVNKPPNMGFHASATTFDAGVLPLLRTMQREGALSYEGRLHAVHRLDRVTSGLLMVAKTAEAAGSVSALLRQRELDKYYVALSGRTPSKKQGRVVGDMARSRRGQWMLTRTRANPAVTAFLSRRVELERGSESDDSAARSLRAFLLKPLTGRTHQLRVALKCLGSPVLGDPMYAASSDAAREDRAYLHAAALRLPAGYPELSGTGDAVAVVCRPHEGAAFRSAAFQRLWEEEEWFSEAAEGTWFAGTAVASRS